MPKLQASSRSFNLNKYIVRGPDGEVIAMELHEGNLHKINFTKMHEVDVVNLIQVWKKDGVLELWYCRLRQLNVKNVYVLQSMVYDMNLVIALLPTSLLF